MKITSVDFQYKTGDKNYIIWGLSGIIFYQHNVVKCYEKQDEILEIMSELFKDEGKFSKKIKRKHDADKSGKSINTAARVNLKSGDVISIHCNDYSKEHGGYFEEKDNIRKNDRDKLSISGTKIRKILERGEVPPHWMMRPEISAMIRDIISNDKDDYLSK